MMVTTHEVAEAATRLSTGLTLQEAPPGLDRGTLARLSDDQIIKWARELHDETDEINWQKCDLFSSFFDRYPQVRRPGRPPRDYDGPTKALVAEQTKEDARRISEFDLNGLFWPAELRPKTRSEFGTFAHYDTARRQVCKSNRDWLQWDGGDEHYRLLIKARLLLKRAEKSKLDITKFRQWVRDGTVGGSTTTLYNGAYIPLDEVENADIPPGAKLYAKYWIER